MKLKERAKKLKTDIPAVFIVMDVFVQDSVFNAAFDDAVLNTPAK